MEEIFLQSSPLKRHLAPTAMVFVIRQHRKLFEPLLYSEFPIDSHFARLLRAIFGTTELGEIKKRLNVGLPRLVKDMRRIIDAVEAKTPPDEIVLFTSRGPGGVPRHSLDVLVRALTTTGPDGKRKTTKELAKELGLAQVTVKKARARIRKFLIVSDESTEDPTPPPSV